MFPPLRKAERLNRCPCRMLSCPADIYSGVRAKRSQQSADASLTTGYSEIERWFVPYRLRTNVLVVTMVVKIQALSKAGCTMNHGPEVSSDEFNCHEVSRISASVQAVKARIDRFWNVGWSRRTSWAPFRFRKLHVNSDWSSVAADRVSSSGVWALDSWIAGSGL